jgi:hypothetical protein
VIRYFLKLPFNNWQNLPPSGHPDSLRAVTLKSLLSNYGTGLKGIKAVAIAPHTSKRETKTFLSNKGYYVLLILDVGKDISHLRKKMFITYVCTYICMKHGVSCVRTFY